MVKAGMIGCGGIANFKHLVVINRMKDVELVAFCDIEIEKAQKAAEEYGAQGAKVFENYKDLLAIPEIEVVYVLTPNRSHSFITVDALNAGKHVMCEKPMAINYAEALKMVETAEKTGKLLTIGYQNRYRPDSLYLKAECEKNTFGEIYYAKAKALRRRAVPTWGVFLNEYEQGGGPLIDIGTHSLDLTLWMMDNYKPKYCIGSTFHKLNKDSKAGNDWGDWDPTQFTVEDSAFGLVVMENGATISVEASWALNSLDTGEAITQLCGTKAGADMFDGLRINGINNNKQYVMIPEMNSGGAAFFAGVDNPHESDIEARIFINAVKGEGELTVKPRQALTVTRILEGIYESAKTGKAYYFE